MPLIEGRSEINIGEYIITNLVVKMGIRGYKGIEEEKLEIRNF